MTEIPSPRITVAVVSDAIAPYHRGGKEMRYAEVLGRVCDDLDVHLYTMHWWKESSRTRREDGITYHAISPLIPLYSGARRSVLEATVFAVACLRLLVRRFDVIEADHMPYLPLFSLWLVAKLRRRPLVVTWHEVWGRDYWIDYLGRRSGTLAWWIERTSMGLPDQILAVSQGTADRLRSYVGHSVALRVIPNAVDLDLVERAEPAEPDDAAELLYVGRLLGHKGVGLLVDAVARLQSERPVRLLIVGDGPERENLYSQVAALGLQDLVRFRTEVADHGEVFSLMKAAQVFVLPSVREGFGIAPLEALACGISVVTTSHPDNQSGPLVARSDRGYLAEPTVEALTASIALALSRSVWPRPPAELWLREFDWSVAARGYLDALVGSVAERTFRHGAQVAPVAAREFAEQG